MDHRTSGPAELTLERGIRAEELSVKVFADGADIEGCRELAANPLISGFTTNPTLMRKAGVVDYEAFARDLLELIPDRPISFEVFSDDFAEMERQATLIAGWGENVYVKIPVTDTRGERSDAVIERLVGRGVRLNVTGLLTAAQVEWVAGCLSAEVPAYVSVFAGRIADAGVDPLPVMIRSLELLSELPAVELIWASPREIFNIVQADAIGCDVITVTHDLLKKLPSLGKDLDQFSLETVRMFHDDAAGAGYSL